MIFHHERDHQGRDRAVVPGRFCVWLILLTVIVCIIPIQRAYGTSLVLDVTEEKREKHFMFLPYVFPDTSTGLAYGPAGAWTGYGQEQMNIVGALMYSSNDSKGLYLLERNYQIPWAERFFVDLNVILADYQESRAYLDGLPGFPERAGSNDSDEDDYLEGVGEDRWGEVRLKYLLPIGNGRDSIIQRYRLKDGLLVEGASGGQTWNPFRGGRTILESRFFWRNMNFDSPDLPIGEVEYKTNGIRLSLEYDNTDFWANPTKGSITTVATAKDFSWFTSTWDYTTVEAEYSKFIDLGTTGSFRQMVLALDVWGVESPSWKSEPNALGASRKDAPPSYTGASLGGFWRMRAYPRFRYHGKSAIYYCAELRLIPYWNPLADMKLLEPLQMDWWQFVPFVEAGRVSDNDWDPGELHEDMQWATGVGLRFMMKRLIARVDVAYSEESIGIKAMFNQPF